MNKAKQWLVATFFQNQPWEPLVFTKRAKRWLAACLFVVAMGVLGATFQCSYAPALMFTFINGESAIAWWVALGIPTHLAISISIVCSTVDIWGWFYLAGDPDSFLQKFIQKKVEQETTSQSRLHRWMHRLPYATLPLFGFIPSLIWAGIGMSKKLGMDQRTSIVLISIGNAFKMIVAGMGIKGLYSLFLH